MATWNSISPEELDRRLRPVLERRPEVLAAFVFGSAARGTAGPLSDIDVAILLADEAACRHRADDYKARLISELMSAAGTSRVDLVLLNEAPPLLAHRVLRD